MRHIKITVGEEVLPISIPLKHSDISFKRFSQAYKEKTPSKMFGALCGVPDEVWEMSGSVELYMLIERSLSFFKKNVTPEKPVSMEIDGRVIYTDSIDILKEEVRRYESLKITVNDYKEDLISGMPQACAIYIQPLVDGRFEPERIGEVAKIIEEQPYLKVVGLGNWLFSVFANVERWHNQNSAETSNESDWERAGFSALSSDFGYMAWVDQLADGNVRLEQEIMKMETYTILRKLQFNSHKFACQERLYKIQQERQKVRR